MQPTTSTPVTPALPTGYMAQAYARFFGHPMPPFFQAVLTLWGSLGTIAVVLNYLQDDLLSHNEAVPDWLTWGLRAIKLLLSLSGIITAKLTIQTPSTPPVGDAPEPTLKELAAQIALLRADKAATGAGAGQTNQPVQP